MASTIRWKFREYLDQNNLTAYQVEKALRGRASRNLPYVWARATKAPARLHTDVLGEVIGALEELTGKPVNVQDLLEYDPQAAPADDGSKAWLEADLSNLGSYDPYDWQEGELEGLGEPLKLGK